MRGTQQADPEPGEGPKAAGEQQLQGAASAGGASPATTLGNRAKWVQGRVLRGVWVLVPVGGSVRIWPCCLLLYLWDG